MPAQSITKPPEFEGHGRSRRGDPIHQGIHEEPQRGQKELSTKRNAGPRSRTKGYGHDGRDCSFLAAGIQSACRDCRRPVYYSL